VRSVFVLILLGVVLSSIALVVRSGMLARKNPGLPINGAMRAAMGEGGGLQWSERDTELIAKNYNGAADTPTGLRYLVRRPGTGDATPQKGQTVTVNYEGRLLENEVVFDSSANHEGPFNFHIGLGSVIAGWDEGVLSMKKGEKRTLIIPYWLAYGEKGITGKIPRRATLVFDIELLDFK
jgi:FKBP-type peptidyl-prolyl cis-trans isomerase